MTTSFYNKSLVFFLALFFFSIDASSQDAFKDLKLEQHTIYLICRATRAKSGLIAEKFNSMDKKITHVGIGYFDTDGLKIYNVTDIDTSKTALVIDNLDSFISGGTYYLSIWKCSNNEEEYLKLKETCSNFSKCKVYFDFTFTLNKNDNILYCSEFCSRVLQTINPKKFNFRPKKLRLESYYRAILKRKKLLYYPVDFFEESTYFTKIFETNLNLKKT